MDGDGTKGDTIHSERALVDGMALLATRATTLSRLSRGRERTRKGGGLDLLRSPREPERISGSTRGEGSHVARALFGGLDRLLQGDPSQKTWKQYQSRVEQINALETTMRSLSDEELRGKTDALRARCVEEGLEPLLVEAFAVAREGARRALGLRPFDVQLVGGMILHEGKIAEMRTGEGKTLVAVLPSFLNALAGRGVHVVTVNDYLARRDCEWVGQVHRFLGLKVGLVQSGMEQEERRSAYNADVTYVTNSELGFDYLRDNLAQSPEELVLRGFQYCIIDEVDSVLVDEARTPLIISGEADKPSQKYIQAARIADAFARDVHYTVDEKQKSVLLSEEGYEAAEDLLQVNDLYDPKEQWAAFLINALKAKELFQKDVNYIVKGGEIVIVDEFTGRTMPGRRWSEGLHQAVEAKEGVQIQNETVTIASISYQNFFRNYPKLAGMTGTAATEMAEFQSIYNLEVSVVPTNKEVKREDSTDVVFRTEEGKWKAVCTEVKRMHKKGRPVLIGTTSVERSEMLAALLDEEGISYELLNAKPENVERESEIIAQSGRKSAVTISTNMAGRGTDILLGGNPEYMARLKLREMLMPKVVIPPEDTIAFEPKSKRKAPLPKRNKWAVSPKLFPCELSKEALDLANSAVENATRVWGEENLDELEAEDRLSFACEKAPTNDEASLALRKAFTRMESEFKEVTDQEKEEVVALGGLHVVGTERHESRRIDNQLRGRSGRQGDPGSTRYFLSLEDNLFRIFGGDRIKSLMKMFQVEDLPIESQMLSNSLDEAQKKVETYFYDMRKQLFEYDQVLNQQRERIYAERRNALTANKEQLQALMIEYAEKTVDDIVEANIDINDPQEDWPLESLAAKMVQYCYLLDDLNEEDLRSQGGFEEIRMYLRKRAVDAYFKKVEEIEGVEEGLMWQAERFFVLTQTDNLWKQHLQAIKFLQTAVGLRGYAQKDPLIEYKLEGYNLFLEMMAQIRRNCIYSVYQFQPKRLDKLEDKKPEVAGTA